MTKMRPGMMRAGKGTITEHRKCRACGYDVIGVDLRGVCPECGVAILADRTIDDPLETAPLEVIRRFRNGCWLACGTVIVALVGGLLLRQGIIRTMPLLGLLMLANGAWLVAAWLVTTPIDSPQAAHQGFHAGSRLRVAARWSQLAWTLLLLFVAIDLTWGAGSPNPTWNDPAILALVAWIGRGLVLLAFAAGVVFVALLMALARWSRDDDAARALNVAVWGLPTAVVLGFVGIPIPFIGFFILGLYLLSILALPFGLFSLARSLSWSLVHHHEHVGRSERRQEAKRRYDERVARSVERMDATRDS